MRAALVTGGSGLVGRALIVRLRDAGVRVLATARSLPAERAVVEAGAEPLHTDLANIGRWERETADADAIFHLGLPRLDPPLRPPGARRRARAAGAEAGALAAIAAGRPVVLASSGLVYGDRPGEPAADDDPPAARPPAVAAAAGAAERALAGPGLRAVRLPWVYGTSGLLRDLIVGLRIRRYRIVGIGENRWTLLGADDAAAALAAAAAAPPGAYTAAEEPAPTQLEVVAALCALPGLRRPDRVAPRFAALSMGGAMAEALGTSLHIRTGALAEHGWAPSGDWRRDVLTLARSPLPPPG
ncbi:MAG TPA: NAD-dependent epimerase/dehydratase family protein [Miltoncostaeaceae bacterium]|nr:NAD-dependent epimerase/dehydratase family protein [Miltoncostaeaceae bacterium]